MIGKDREDFLHIVKKYATNYNDLDARGKEALRRSTVKKVDKYYLDILFGIQNGLYPRERSPYYRLAMALEGLKCDLEDEHLHDLLDEDIMECDKYFNEVLEYEKSGQKQ